MTDGTRNFDFALNPDAGLAIHRIGAEGEPVIVIDHVMTNPQALIDYAAAGTPFTGSDGPGYPGVRAPAPLNYVEAVARKLDPLIRQTFNLQGVALAQAECSFSIVTTPPDRLAPIQRIPHIDTSYPLQFAILHYLCDGKFGGTAFYRHKASGLEIITGEGNDDFTRLRDAELAASTPLPGYIGPESEHYVQTGAFEALFDRVLVYRSCRLHCGLIPPTMALSPDPRRGRLTANIFVNYAQF
jgi:hypothetical protein